MNTEEKIYSLMAQAEDMQAHAVVLQRSAQDAVKTLPEAIRDAAQGQAREIITEAAKNASEGILEASREAMAAVASMRRTWLRQCASLIALGVVVATIVAAGIWWGTEGLREERAELQAKVATLKAAIQDEETTLAEMKKKTWGLELVDWGKDGRGIILPKGVKFVRSGPLQDGREAIVIKP